ncbi:hypothetical protein ALC53_05828 [Atta colombica]|uniref:Uncharacterized protein n=1 Tax=Atta colombica TaxID=520822 RepID=A0A151I3M7_9HYME|nr:hypothetical protein ALC53_05828 [Atta colombica]
MSEFGSYHVVIFSDCLITIVFRTAIFQIDFLFQWYHGFHYIIKDTSDNYLEINRIITRNIFFTIHYDRNFLLMLSIDSYIIFLCLSLHSRKDHINHLRKGCACCCLIHQVT